MNAFAHSETALLLPVLLCGLAHVLIPRLIALLALAMVLWGSRPGERPALLDACAQSLRHLLRPSFRPASRDTQHFPQAALSPEVRQLPPDRN
ncbi:hypothetical protein Acor_44630 [Acrocarpospora corrugata]|uniref:Uncharacterized protein n=1 Tax=Acrocarpospora corrugata TaxID=35763 RepID=A0A5M3VZV0_9ACTN|nr:hypothetical protein [Acrocarpospora corrugata]GES02397.1 hypothetical protein Acor_44630 [Acrocarpospora corrugata]